jgi:hypothetical protein
MMTPIRGRLLRRCLQAGAVILAVFAGLIVSLPVLLALPIVQHRIAAVANRILAPGSVEFSSARFSWFKPIEITNLVLRDAQGDRLIVAPRTTLGWGLWQVVVTHPKELRITIERGDLDIERFADGTLDLYETLRPVISEHPRIRIIANIQNGRLRFRDPLFSEPVISEQSHFFINLGRHYEPITWDFQLAQGREQDGPRRLGIVGKYSRADIDKAGRHDLSLALKGSRWPWTLANSMIKTQGDLTGDIDGQMRMGRVRISGDATISDLVASGDLLSSDKVHLKTLRAQVGFDGGDDSWTIDRLELTSPVGSLRGHGSIPPKSGNGAWLDAAVDLAAVAKQLPSALHLRDGVRVERGQARLRADIQLRSDGKTEDWIVSGKVSDLAARQGEKRLALPEPASLVLRIQRKETAATLERFEVNSGFLTAAGHGDVDRGVAVSATLDLAVLRDRFRDWIDLKSVELAGKGKLEARYQRHGGGYQADVNVAFQKLQVVGLPLIQKLERDQSTLDAAIRGKAASSGWPQAWQEISLRAASDGTNLELMAQRDAATAEVLIAGRGSSELTFDGRPQRVEGALKAQMSGPDQLRVTELKLMAPYVRIEGSGVVRDLMRRAEVDFTGTLNPEWEQINAILTENVEPGAQITGGPRAWRIAGRIDERPTIDQMGSWEGEIGVKIDSVDVLGMRLSDVPVVLRAAKGRLAVDPIDASLNGGRLHLEPELVRAEDGSIWLHMGPDSRLDGAVVNDDVSHRVLAFAAPVLDGATRVQGRVSFALADAWVPIFGAGGAQARMEGAVSFDDFRFMPGRLADQLLSVFQLDRRPLAVLRDPVAIRVADRKVHQRGLTIPVVNVASIGLDGSVDFDRNLDLVAHFGVIPPRAGVPVLTPIMQRARFDLPIRGTLKNPKIDADALKRRWKDFGIDLLGDSVEAGVNGLQRLLEGLQGTGLGGLIPRARRAMPPPPPRPEAPDEADRKSSGDRDSAPTDQNSSGTRRPS